MLGWPTCSARWATRRRASWLSWVSPLGWVERVQPYAGPRWWLPLFVRGRRRRGRRRGSAGGPPGPGRRTAPGPARPAGGGGPAAQPAHAGLAAAARRPWLGGRLRRCPRGAGVAAKGIGATLNSSPQARPTFLRMGGQPGWSTPIWPSVRVAQASPAAFAVAAVLRLHGEEAERRAEHAGRPGGPGPLGGQPVLWRRRHRGLLMAVAWPRRWGTG